VTPTEHSQNSASLRTGTFVLLSSLLRVKGTAAPKISRRASLPLALLLTLSALALTAAPALAAAPEPPEALKPEPIKPTAATLKGIVNPKISAATEPGTYQFEYKATKTATKAECESAGATKAPASPGTYLGLEPEPESEPVSPLTEGTEYIVCLAATTAGGTTVGPPFPFQTGLKLETPVNVKVKAGSITATTAEVEGELNPGKERKVDQGSFEIIYKLSALSAPPTGECEESATSAQSTSGAKEEKVAEVLKSLEPNAKYTFCLRVHNEDGEEATGAPVTFTTKPAPATIDHEAVSNIKATEATLEGAVNPNNQLTECHFQYGALSVSEHAVPCTPELLTGFGEQTVSPTRTEVKEGAIVKVPAPITGLAPDTSYHYRILTKNGSGEVEAGTEESFETALPPETPEALKAEPIAATEATLHGALNPGGERSKEPGSYEFRYRQSASECQGGKPGEEKKTPPTLAAGLKQNEPAEAKLEGLLPGTTYTFCLLAKNEAGEASGVSAPETFTTLPARPALAAEEAKNLTATSATLTARINPNGAEVTTCEFEYGTEAGVYPNKVACAPSPGSGTAAVPVSGQAEPLAANTTYHWRLLATNAVGTTTSVDHTFIDLIGSPAEASCAGLPEPQRRQQERVRVERGSTALPDCRAYELVTPPQKNGALIGELYLSSGASWPQIAGNGQRVIAPSIQCFAQAQGCVGFRSSEGEPFAFTRTGGGWATTPLTPPGTSFETSTRSNVSADAGTVLFIIPRPQSELNDFYALGEGGSPLAIGPFGDREGHTNLDVLAQEGLISTPDLSHVVYQTKGTAWSFDHAAAPNFTYSLYEYVGAGNAAPLLVGVSGGYENGENHHLISQCGTPLGAAGGRGTQTAYGTMSADGRTVYFTAIGRQSGEYCPEEATAPQFSEIYARIDGERAGARSVLISAPTPGTCEEPECKENTTTEVDFREPSFEGASTDGSRAFFTDTQQLTDHASEASASFQTCNARGGPGDPGCNLYESVCAQPCGKPGEEPNASGRELVDVSETSGHTKVAGGPRVQGPVAISPDGSHVYFVAKGKLTGEEQNQSHEKAQEETDNLYVYERDKAFPEGHLTFVTTLSPADETEWQYGNLTANVTPDGRFLVFTSHRALTADLTRPEGPAQVFEYDAQTKGLVRVSIGEGAFNDNGNAGTANASIVPVISSIGGSAPVRADPTMSDDGSFVFFQSPVALTPGALNDVPVGEKLAQNVYSYHEGHVSLISDGKDTTTEGAIEKNTPVELLGSDTTGSNVFFTTFDRLVPEDGDTQRDIYDAHVCSAEAAQACPPPTPAPPPPCEGEACHGQAPGASLGQPPASESFTGPGNLTPPPPPKGRTAAQIRAEKLAKALKACRKKHNRHNRAVCEKHARKLYGKAAKAKAKAKKAKKSNRATTDRRAK
jgi:hypothetical protein